jgi:hypothetical protein
MTGRERSTRERFGAIFFAFVMVTSMVALGGLAGTAAATASNVDLGNNDGNAIDVSPGDTITPVVDTSSGSEHVSVIVDINDNDVYDSGTDVLAFDTGLGTSGADKSIDEQSLNFGGISEGTYDVHAVEQASTVSDTDDISASNVDVINSGQVTVDSASPTIQKVQKIGGNSLQITFSEGVYNTQGTPSSGSLATGDFAFVNNNGQDAGSGTGFTGITHSAGSNTVTLTTDNTITTADIGTDAVNAVSSEVFDEAGNSAPATEVTIQRQALSGGGNGMVSYDIGTSATQSIVAGSADQELNQIRIQDQSGGEFSGLLTISMPDGVSINESASNLNLNTVTTLDGTVTIDSVSVVNSGNDIEFDLSGTSSAGERIRIKPGALHVSTDGSTFDTGSATSGTSSLDVSVEHFSGTLNTDTDTGSNGLVTATSPTTGNPGATGEALNINTDSQNLDDRLQVSGIDQNEVGADTNLVLTVDGTGTTFDQSVDLTTVIGASDGTEDDLDVDGDGTDELDVANASITDTTLTVPVNNTITDNNGFPYTVAFRTSDADAGEGVRFNTSGAATGAADLNVTVESTAPSTGSYQLGAVDSPTFNDRINGIDAPSLDFTSDAKVVVGANNQDPANDLTIDLSTPVQENTFLNITTNNTDVTFDTSTDVSASDLSYGNDIGSGNINNVTVESDVIAIGLGTETSEADGDFGGDGGDEITIGFNSENKFSLNVSSAPVDNTKVQFNATNNPVQFVDSTNVLDLERPDVSLNNGANAPVAVDNDGGQFEVDPAAGQGLTIQSDDINGQISDATNVTITLESDTGVTFDKSADVESGSDAVTGGSANDDDGDFSIYGDSDGDLTNGHEELLDNNDGDGTFSAVTVNENTIEIALDDDGSGANAGPSDSLAQDDVIVIDELPLNATAGATNTTISVTTNTSDAEVTTELAQIIATSQDTPSNLAIDADGSNDFDDFNNGQVTGVQNPQVDETVAGAVRVQNGGNFGGADVTLEIVETPEGSSGSSLNTTQLTTNQDGEAFYNFTAGDTTGDYVVNASIDGVSGGLNITYTAQPGAVADVNVTPIENAIVGGSGDLDQAALYVNATDANGNPVTATPTVDVTADNVGASEISAYEDKDSDGSRNDLTGEDDDLTDGSFTIDDTNNDGSSVIEINSDQVEDVTVTVSYQGNSDSGTVTFYDQVGQIDLALNQSTVTVGDTVSAEATISESDGTTIEVPGVTIDYDDNTNGNTTFAGGADADSAATNDSGVASVTVTAEQNGTSTIDARTNLRADSTTLTIDEQADTGSPLGGTAGEYDADGDGKVTASELGDAVTAFGQGDLTASELGDVVTAFGQS